MNLNPIPVTHFRLQPNDLWANTWLLLTAGDYAAGKYNTMTVGWGSFGVMWGKPFVQIVVRPTRYTYTFMENYTTFTLTAFPEVYRKALSLLGSKSGRHGDKIAEAGLTPMAARVVAAPAFQEAELVIECQKMYWDDFKPDHFLAPDIERSYPKKDYHRIYFGEIVAIAGVERYAK